MLFYMLDTHWASQVLTEICSICFSGQCDLTKNTQLSRESFSLGSQYKEMHAGKVEVVGARSSRSHCFYHSVSMCVYCMHLSVQVGLPIHTHAEAVAESLAC